MIEYLVLFETLAHAERAGLLPSYTTKVGDFYVVLLRVPLLPWGLIRECVSYAQTCFGQHTISGTYVHTAVSAECYTKAYLYKIVDEVISLNLAPVKINQW